MLNWVIKIFIICIFEHKHGDLEVFAYVKAGQALWNKKPPLTRNNELEDLFFLCVIVGQVSQINPVVFCWVFYTLHTQTELGQGPKYRNKKSRVIWRLSERIYSLEPGTSEGFFSGSEHLHWGHGPAEDDDAREGLAVCDEWLSDEISPADK